MDPADLGRWIEDVLVTLARAKDRDGLYVMLSAEQRTLVLAGAITAVNNERSDTRLFQAISLSDLVKEP